MNESPLGATNPPAENYWDTHRDGDCPNCACGFHRALCGNCGCDKPLDPGIVHKEAYHDVLCSVQGCQVSERVRIGRWP